MYDLGFAIPLDGVHEVPPGTTILLAGPPTVPTTALAHELLAAGQRRGDGVVLVTTREDGALARAAYEGVTGNSLHEPTFRVVDASPYTDESDGGAGIEMADSPADLTGLGRGMARARDTIEGNGADGVRVGLDSVSVLLEHLDETTVYKFLHTITDRMEATGSLGVVTLDTTDDHRLLYDAFDAVVEFRETDAGRECRAVGFAGVPANWQEVETPSA